MDDSLNGSPPVIPAVRLANAHRIHEEGSADTTTAALSAIVDLPPSDKFAFAWPGGNNGSSTVSPPLSAAPGNNSFESDNDSASNSEMEVSGPESFETQAPDVHDILSDGRDQTPTNEHHGHAPVPASTSIPRLSRAFSLPLASQLGYLRHPQRTSDIEKLIPPALETPYPHAGDFQDIALELADSVQMVVQTLLQISPPQVLDPAKEQFSGCALSIPSASVSAMLTSLKGLNYMSANMTSLCPQTAMDWLSQPRSNSPNDMDDFDIGETLQSVGDALSGMVAQCDVDLVLFHADVGMKHVSVKGDESGLSFALSHVIRQIIDTAHAGDTIEIGLLIVSDDTDAASFAAASRSDSPLPVNDGPLRCTFEISHKFATTGSEPVSGQDIPTIHSLSRLRPALESPFLRRLLRHVSATLKTDLQPRLFALGRSCEFTVKLQPGSPLILTQPPQRSAEEEALRQPFASANIQLATEPSLEELMLFVDTLKGKKVALHASAKGSFAHHLTSYLTAWGLDVSHMPVVSGEAEFPPIPNPVAAAHLSRIDEHAGSVACNMPLEGSNTQPPIADPSAAKNGNGPGAAPAFIIIDDDTGALRRRLLQMRAEAPYAFNLQMRQRPSLASQQRPRSSPQVTRAKGPHSTNPASSLPVLLHFTSLSNFKTVKDLIHSILSTFTPSNIVPEIIVLPKPAGPRRVLTALRTAILKPIVDPFFSPIATSPLSPSIFGIGPLHSPFAPSHRSSRPPISPRTNSDRSAKSVTGEAYSLPPPSPLGMSDNMEYFSEAAVKLGTSPSSGLVIQSPDGQPAGIFFHPRGATPKSRKSSDTRRPEPEASSGPPVPARDYGNLKPPHEGKRAPTARKPSNGERPSPDRPKVERPPLTPVPPKQRIKSATPQRTDEAGPSSARLPSPTASSSVAVGLPTLLETASGVIPVYPRGTQSDSSLKKNVNPATAASPPPIATPKRVLPKRTTTDVAAANGASKKTGENNIVPPINVLIVEDNPINQTILSTFMRKKKIKYDVAKNGAEAVSKWKSGSFHLILMDIQMPVMDGIEATKEIRRIERQNSYAGLPATPSADGAQTPSDVPSFESKSTAASMNTPFRSSVIIVALTASSLQSDREAALAAGCNDFLTKPVSLLWLNNKIIEWGSIKALQMWADLRPEVVKSLTNGQLAQAKTIASKLHVPEGRTRGSSAAKSPLVTPQPSTLTQFVEMPVVEWPGDKSPASSGPRIGTAFDFKDSIDSAKSPGSGLSLSSAGPSTSKHPASTQSGAAGLYSIDDNSAPPSHSDLSSIAPVPIPDLKIPPEAVVNDAQPCQIQRPGLDRRPSLQEVTGEEALLVHLKETAEVEEVERRSSLILGDRSPHSSHLTIAEVLHHSDSSSGSLPKTPGESAQEDAQDAQRQECAPQGDGVTDDRPADDQVAPINSS